jgi:hypothetical protein
MPQDITFFVKRIGYVLSQKDPKMSEIAVGSGGVRAYFCLKIP